MRKLITLSLVLCLACIPIAGSSAIAKAYARGQYQGQYQDNYGYENYTPQQLDNLLAPIALYPDPLLAQVLIAATFPDQIQDASDWVHRYGANPGIDDQPWDISVRAVAHYPTVLYMMDDKIDWTAAVGQAYVNQSTDVMSSVQNLRGLARAEGNLISTPQQQVIYDGGYIQIVPAEPRYIFVPTYDPGVIYTRRVYTGSSFGGFFSFGSGFAIGAWLNYDLDWGSRRVVYDDWQGAGWRQRSRPFIQVNNVYVNNRYQNVVVNRTVVNRQVNYQNVDQFNSVHRDVKFDNRPRGNGQPVGRPGQNSGQNDNNANRNPRNVQGSQPQGSVPPQPAQQAPPVPQQNNPRQNNPPQNNTDNRDRGGQRGGVGGDRGGQNPPGQNPRGVPPAAVQPAQPVQPERTVPPPPAQEPPVPRQNNPRQNNSDRGAQNQAPPARVEPARPIPPAAQPAPATPAGRPQQAQPAQQRGGQQPAQDRNGNGRNDKNNKDNKDNKDNQKGQ